MKIIFSPNPNADINRTSFHSCSFTATIDELTALFGRAHVNNPPDEKTTTEWFFSDEHSACAIYDWKHYRILSPTEKIVWHIGSRTKSESIVFKEWIESQLLKLRSAK